MINKNIKGVGPVIAVAMLFIIATISAVAFNSWFNDYSSKTFSNVETKSTTSTNTQINQVIDDTLFFINGNNKNLTIKQIKFGSIICNVTNINFISGMNQIDLRNCTKNISNSINDIVVITNNEIYTKSIYLKNEIVTEINLAVEEIVEEPIVENWFNQTFEYKRKIEFNNFVANQTDIQVSFEFDTSELISSNVMYDDCSDIRITYQGNDLEIPFWIKDSTCDTINTEIFVRMPYVNTTGNYIYIYYGNTSNAISKSNGNEVFDLFDDFNDGVLNTSIWNFESLGGGSYTESSGTLKLIADGARPTYAYLYSKEQFSINHTIETYRTKVTTGSDSRGPSQIVGFSKLGSNIRLITEFSDESYLQYTLYNDGTNYASGDVGSGCTEGTFCKIILNWYSIGSDKKISFIWDSTNGNSDDDTYIYSNPLNITIKSASYSNGDDNTGYQEVDYIFLKKYLIQEPDIVIGNQEYINIFENSFIYKRDINFSGFIQNYSDVSINFTLDTQSLILVGKMKSDCSDIEFRNENMILTHFIESNCNSSNTKLFVEILDVNSSNYIVEIHYGNLTVDNGIGDSSINSFQIFDDFSSDPEIYSVLSTTHRYIIKTFDPTDYLIMEYDIKLNTISSDQFGSITRLCLLNDNNYMDYFSNSYSFDTDHTGSLPAFFSYDTLENGLSPELSPMNLGESYHIKTVFNKTNYKNYINDTLILSKDISDMTINQLSFYGMTTTVDNDYVTWDNINKRINWQFFRTDSGAYLTGELDNLLITFETNLEITGINYFIGSEELNS